MAGLLDFLLGQQGGGGLLGMPQQGGPAPMQMPQQGYGANYMNTDTGGLLGSFRGALNQIANPQGLQQAYEQKDAQRAGMALLNALPGGQQTAPPHGARHVADAKRCPAREHAARVPQQQPAKY
jgi:hypothetical protein